MLILLRIIFYIILAYLILFVIRIILSLFKMHYNKYNIWLCRITDPAINLFKKAIPIQIGIYEISSLIPVFILYLILIFISDLINIGMQLSIYYIVYFALFTVKIIFMTIAFSLTFFTVVLLITGSRYEYSRNQFTGFAKNMTKPFLLFLKKITGSKLFRTDSGYYIMLLIIVILCAVIINIILDQFTNYFHAMAVNYSIKAITE